MNIEFEESLKNFASRIKTIKEKIGTEEATKTALIMPFFQVLGYDIFNPNEFVPEFVADVGIKKGEKVDYAIVLNDKVTVLIEAKSINEQLHKHDSQLFRYFGTSSAKFAILTNGVNYKFYTDLEEVNKMDTTPFLDIDLLDLKENDIAQIRKFHRNNFDINAIINTASDLKYFGLINKVLEKQFDTPSDEFVKLILSSGVYEGVKTQNVIEKFSPIIKKAINYHISELINERLQSALQKSEGIEEEVTDSNQQETNDGIVTTIEEMESYYIVKSILAEHASLARINYKDTYSYLAVLFDNKVTKWICRIYLRDNVKYIIIPNESKEEVKYKINNVNDIYMYKNQLIQRVKSFSVNVEV